MTNPALSVVTSLPINVDEAAKASDIVAIGSFGKVDVEDEILNLEFPSVGDKKYSVMVDVVNIDPTPTYLNLTSVLTPLGYRRATNRELLSLGAQHSKAIFDLTRGHSSVSNGRLSDSTDDDLGEALELAPGDNGLELRLDPDAPDEEINGYIAVVKTT